MAVGIAGYVSSCVYKQIGGDGWVWNIVMTASLFSGVSGGLACSGVVSCCDSDFCFSSLFSCLEYC